MISIFPKEAVVPGQRVDEHGLVPAHFPKRSVRFAAQVDDDAGVKWSIEQGGGEINEVGEFFAPDSSGKSTVQATSITDKKQFAQATVAY
jgi:hypothetical protein